jgi:hypothetical protein
MICGLAPLSSSCAHGRLVMSIPPWNWRTPTGLTPSASAKSWSLKPTATTRSGGCSTTVVPNLCSIVTGKPASVCCAGALLSFSPQPPTSSAASAAINAILITS